MASRPSSHWSIILPTIVHLTTFTWKSVHIFMQDDLQQGLSTETRSTQWIGDILAATDIG
jgi:hypothetical protein